MPNKEYHVVGKATVEKTSYMNINTLIWVNAIIIFIRYLLNIS